MAARTIHHPAASELDLATIMRAVGDPVRLAIVAELDGEQEQTCTVLAAKLGMPMSTFSYHLRQLREAGVTHSRAAGTERLIRLREDELEERFPGLVPLLRENAQTDR